MIVFFFFTEILTRSLGPAMRVIIPVSKAVGVNIAFTRTFIRAFDNLSNNIQVHRLFPCDSLVIDL